MAAPKIINFSTVLKLSLFEAHGLPVPEPEYVFDLRRRWRFDFAWLPPIKLALEQEGGVWTRGRHTRGTGFLKDMEKYNEAVLAGWRVLRCTPKDFETGAVVQLVKRALGYE